MTRSTRQRITRVINRFERAVYNKAFEGTVPWDEEEAVVEHHRIEREYLKARQLLERLIYETSL